MTNKQNDKEPNIYDEIRSDIRKKQASIPPNDAESVLAALSGPATNNAELLASLSGQSQPQPITKKGENK